MVGEHGGDVSGFVDVVRAYFRARARMETYVDLPRKGHEEGKCGKLDKAMNGTRGAAQNWGMDYTEMMVGARFKQGAYSACVVYHEERNIRAVVHGDDFKIWGKNKALDWFRKVVERRR